MTQMETRVAEEVAEQPPERVAEEVAVHAPEQTAGHGHHGYFPQRDAYLKRIRRIEGQVRGIERMISQDVYCIDVLTQISAVTRALQAVSLGLLEDHIANCVVDAAKASEEEGTAKVKEATAAIARLWKS